MNRHRVALDEAVNAAGGNLTTIDNPLVELARSLADQVDAAGVDGPGTRLAGTYATVLRTLQARIGEVAGPLGSGNLARLRAAVQQNT